MMDRIKAWWRSRFPPPSGAGNGAPQPGAVVELSLPGGTTYWTRVRGRYAGGLDVWSPPASEALWRQGLPVQARILLPEERQLQLEGRIESVSSDRGRNFLRLRAIGERRSLRRRQALRVRTDLPARIHATSDGVAPSGKPFSGRIFSLSPGGAALFVSERLPVGEDVLVRIQLQEGRVRAGARVVRSGEACDTDGGLVQRAHIEFTHIGESEEAAVTRFVYAHQRRRGAVL